MMSSSDDFAFELFLARVTVDPKLRHQFIGSPDLTLSCNGIEPAGPIIVSFSEDLHFPSFETIDGSVVITLPLNSSPITVQQLPATTREELLVGASQLNQTQVTVSATENAVTSAEVQGETLETVAAEVTEELTGEVEVEVLATAEVVIVGSIP